MSTANKLLALSMLLLAGCAATPLRPNLLFSQDALPALREKVKAGGVPQRAYEAMLKRCETHLKLAEPVEGKTGDTLVDLGLAWRLTGEPRYGDKLAMMVKMAREKNLSLGEKCHDVPLIYDLGREAFAPEERRWLKEKLVAAAKSFKASPMPAVWLAFSNWGPIVQLGPATAAAALKGEPEYDQATLDKAADELRRCLSHWIGPDGAVLEHGAYLDYGMTMNGDVLALALARQGRDVVSGTNLPQLPAWYALETSPLHPMGWEALGDCGLQPIHFFTLRTLLALMPDNPEMNQVALMSGAEDDPAPDPLSGIIFHRQPNPALAAKAKLPTCEFFPSMNLLLYKSDFSPEAFRVASQARWEIGHTHSDIGSFVLWANGQYWAMDSGYGEGAAGAHNLVLVNNRGPSNRSLGGLPLQRIISPFAVTTTTDSLDAWNAECVGSNMETMTVARHPAAMSAARRSLAIMPDGDGAPPYLLVSDFLQKDGRPQDYTWVLQLNKDRIFRHEGRRSTITVPAEASHLMAQEGKTLAQEIEVPEDGDYRLYAYVKGNCYLNGFVDKKQRGYCHIGGLPWIWACLGNPVKLSKGKHLVGLSYHSGPPPRLKYLALAKEIPSGTVKPEDVAGSVAEATGWPVEKNPMPELDVFFMAPDGVELRNDYIDSYGRFKGNWHQRLRAEFKQAAWGRFVALLYPRQGGMPPLKLEPFAKQGFRYRALWPSATDYFAFDDKGAGLSVVRAPTAWQPGTPPPKELRYLVTNGPGLSLVEFWTGEKTPIVQQGLRGVAACSGERLDVDVVVDPQSARWRIERLVNVRAFGPKVKTVFVDGKPVPFAREGDYVVCSVRARMPISGEEAYAEAMRQNLEAHR